MDPELGDRPGAARTLSRGVQESPILRQGFGERLSSPGYTGFPNGRRIGDDTIDVLLFFISNGGLTTGDNVNANDVTFRDAFPFFAPSHQPRDTGVLDDNTRN